MIALTVLAIDPGRQKCGLAIVDEEMGVLKKLIIPVLELPGIAGSLSEQFAVTTIILGDRTGSKDIYKSLKTIGLPIELIDESKSSIEGRYRYLKENTKGLARLIPIGLRSPKGPFDDYVAVILAERFLTTKIAKGMK